MAQHDRARIAEKGWRLPRDLRMSGMSENTSMSGRGCGIIRVGFHERVLGHGGVPGKRGPTWNKTLSLVLGLICNLFPKTEWPWGKVLELALARPFHHHVDTRWDCFWPPGPVGHEDGVSPRFHQRVEAPRGACTCPLHPAPCMAHGRPQALRNPQQSEDCPLQL